MLWRIVTILARPVTASGRAKGGLDRIRRGRGCIGRGTLFAARRCDWRCDRSPRGPVNGPAECRHPQQGHWNRQIHFLAEDRLIEGDCEGFRRVFRAVVEAKGEEYLQRRAMLDGLPVLDLPRAKPGEIRFASVVVNVIRWVFACFTTAKPSALRRR